MNSVEIMSHIGDEAVRLICLDTVDSTNLFLRRMLDSGEKSTVVAVARAQTQGRGRRGKSFYSPFGTGLYLSVLLHPGIAFEDGMTLSSKACIAVSEAIEKTVGIKTAIKWVNDLYLDNKKVCGILCECVNDYAEKKITDLIIGVGINISTADFPSEIANIAGSLGLNDECFDKLAGAVASNLIGIKYGKLDEAELEYYNSRSAVKNKNIDYYINGEKFCAVAQDIDSNAGLVIKKKDGSLSTLTSGEITVRFS